MQLDSLITANTVSFENSDEHGKLVWEGWTTEREQTMRAQYGSRVQQEISNCMAEIVRLREQDHITPSALARFSLLRQSSLQNQLNTLFKNCHQNR